MANPITWKNINAPDFSSANRLMSDGYSNLSQAFKDGADVVNDYTDQQTQKATERLQAEIAGLQDLEGYGDLRQSVTDQLAGMNGFVDTNAVMSDLNKRDDQLRTDATNLYNFNESVRRQNEAPLIAQINTQIAKDRLTGDFSASQALINQNQGNIQDTSALTDAIQDGKTAFEDRQWTLEDRRRDQESYEREEERRIQTEQANNIIRGLYQDDSLIGKADARKALLSQIGDLRPEVREQAFATLDQGWDSRFSLTDIQNERYQELQRDDETRYTNRVNAANTQFETVAAQNPVIEKFNVKDSDGFTKALGDINQITEEGGVVDWAQGALLPWGNESGAMLTRSLQDDQQEYLDEVGGDDQLAGVAMYLAAQQVLDGKTGEGDIDIGDFKKAYRAIAKQVLQNEQYVLNLAQAASERKNAIADAELNKYTTSRTYRNEARLKNRGLLQNQP